MSEYSVCLQCLSVCKSVYGFVCVCVCMGGFSSVPRCQELEEAMAHGDTDNH